ncbi:MAG: glycosyltransferase family 4 protein [Actinomycetota bacterium]|nr:glycosyltransferase family 4 protein [Actinomycetota bacterium]
MEGPVDAIDYAGTETDESFSVLRLCSVFEPPEHVDPATVASFDPIGGMQNHTAELTRALDRLGFRQTVVTSRPPGYPPVSRAGRFTVRRVELPIPTFRQFYGVAAATRVARLDRHDVVHMHLGEDLAIVPLGTLASKRRAPTVLTIHCDLGRTFNGRGARAAVLRSFGSRLERIGARQAHAVIVLSESAKKAMLEWSIEEERVHVIPPGVVPELFKGPFADPLPSVGRPRIIYVGRIAQQKDVQTLVRAVAFLRSNAHLVIVGDGPDRRRMERLAESLGIRERLTITGFVRHEKVPAFLHHADVLVLPSRFEELGSVLLEGMCIGMPIVASRVRGITSVIDHESNGLLVSPGDSQGFAAAIDRVLANRLLARRLAHQSHAGSARFTWSSLADRVASIYLDVLDEARRPSAPRNMLSRRDAR